MTIKRALQTRFGLPEGNCYEACLAMVFGVDISEVPDRFLTYGREITGDEEHTLFQPWFRERGVYSLRIFTSEMKLTGPCVPTSVIISGLSPRGQFDHAVVGHWNGSAWELLDPHPSGDGIVEVHDIEVFLPYPTMERQ